MEEKIKEYDKYFKNFYNEYFKYKHQFKENNNQSNKKLKCLECTTNKRFILDEDELIFSCGPKNSEDKKCGKQYTIKLPKYINFRELYELYNEQINGTFNYTQNNLLEYDLQNLSGKLNIGEDLEKQIQLIKNSKISFDKLISDYNEYNNLNEYKEKLMNLSEKRYKNSIEKKKIMRELNDKDTSSEEKIILRREYAVLIQESQNFIDMIIKLREENTDFIMIKKPEIINHKIEKPNKPNKPKNVKEDKPTDKPKEKIKKYSYDEQVKILLEYYKKVDFNKSEEDVIGILNRRRHKDFPIGTRLPTKPWLNLCDKLQKKYVYHPLKMKEEEDKFIQELDDGTKILVDSLSPDSPR